MSFRKPGPNKRVCAALIDSFIASFIGGVLAILIDASWLPSLASGIVFLLRDALPGGQSIGKRIVGLQIAPVGEAELNMLKASVLRNLPLALAYAPGFSAVLSGLPVVAIFILEYALVLKADEGRRLGDKLAGTRVKRWRGRMRPIELDDVGGRGCGGIDRDGRGVCAVILQYGHRRWCPSVLK